MNPLRESFIDKFIDIQKDRDENLYTMPDDEEESSFKEVAKYFYRRGAYDLLRFLALGITKIDRQSITDLTRGRQHMFVQSYVIGVYATTQMEIEELKKQYDEMEKKKEALHDKLQEVGTQREALDIEVRALRDENARLTERIKFLETQGGAHQQNTDELYEKYKKLKATVEKGLGTVLDSFTNILTEIK